MSIIKKIFWKLPIDNRIKEKAQQLYFEWRLRREKKYDLKNTIGVNGKTTIQKKYIEYVLASYKARSKEYEDYRSNNIKPSTMLAAFYLTQFHPNIQNDLWWGKGTTEWNNVNQAVPQFEGHYQPRKPGELGYYDLRLKENIKRQIEIATNYGVGAFCFYYYWFDGKRLLEQPLNIFLNNLDLDIPFFYCWANENWTKRYSGTDDDILIKLTHTQDNYEKFIDSVLQDMTDRRYYCIDGRPVLMIYRPGLIENCKIVLDSWRNKAKKIINKDLYIIAIQNRDTNIDWVSYGFDSESQFQPASILNVASEDKSINLIRSDFGGKVYDYSEIVSKKKYIDSYDTEKKVYPAVMPMWDNTARRNFRGTIFNRSTPTLYRQWLVDAIEYVHNNHNIDNLVFINAWNEWGEGAYLEPDEFYGYAYLNATYEALAFQEEKENARNK